MGTQDFPNEHSDPERQQPPAFDFRPPKRVNRRHQRRTEAATFRIRVELIDAEPMVWRTLDIRSDTYLPRVHMVLQAAMGWENVHLHEFVHAPAVYQRDAERFVSFDMPDAEEFGALDESKVRLDEFLHRKGDQFVYSYDFGDAWDHLVTLEAIADVAEIADVEDSGNDSAARASRASATSAVIRDASMLCPPEDSGGIPAYNEAMALIRERGQQLGVVEVEDDAVAMLVAAYTFAPTEINLKFAQRQIDLAASAPSTLDEVYAAEAERLDLFLGLIGDGITLTKADWLPPKLVKELMSTTGLHREWIGEGNREIDTWPVSEIREWAHALKLVRRYKGQLRPSRLGISLRGNRDELAQLVRESLPFERMYRTEFTPALTTRAMTRYQPAAQT